MRTGKFPVWILVVCNILLIGLCVFLYIRMDRNAPTIEFSENDAVYTEAVGQDELLVGVSAYDDTDKDITGRIVIEKINKNLEENKVTVFYAVSDRCGNVARMSRVFPAEFEDTGKADKEVIRELAKVEETKPIPVPTPIPEPTPDIVEPEATFEPTPEPTPEPTVKPVPKRMVRQNSAPAPAEEAPVIDPNSIDPNSIDPSLMENPDNAVPDLSNIDMSQIDMSQIDMSQMDMSQMDMSQMALPQ